MSGMAGCSAKCRESGPAMDLDQMRTDDNEEEQKRRRDGTKFIQDMLRKAEDGPTSKP